ncbi:hypothetical protein BVG16_14540 [Paenibacillus selenitireducens]|uniref:DUF3243 domain-containing protein n=1 Tax=Paenibacillus selenitireducens TaxID=1324314 RepID=A0A1T2XCT3_9BACL|nr:DUF3243 domain-containing protein [Paenibacillus selenitireducens]OPA77660.1 hypothetical protein BVG16_14540 [Paenibacillus selenitireducens]
MSVLGNYDNWKNFLKERVQQAKAVGISDEAIAKFAYEIGDFLDEKVSPKNGPEQALKELWDVGSEQDRQTIARLMVKLVEKG